MEDRRTWPYGLVLFAMVIGAVCAIAVLRRPAPERSVARDLARRVAAELDAHDHLVRFARHARSAQDLESPAKEKLFWEFAALGPLEDGRVAPLTPLLFLNQGADGMPPDDRLRAVVSYYRHGRVLCPTPVAARLLAQTEAAPPHLRAPILEIAAQARAPGAVEEVARLWTEGALDSAARDAACTLIAVHADRPHARTLTELHAALGDADRTALAQALASVFPGIAPDRLADSVAPPDRLRVLRSRDPAHIAPVFAHLRLYWHADAFAPLADLLEREQLDPALRGLAIDALSLADTPGAVDVVIRALDSTAVECAARAAAVLRLLTGQDFPDPSPEMLFDPELGTAALARRWRSESISAGSGASLNAGVAQGSPAALRRLIAHADAGLLLAPGPAAAVRKLLATFPALPLEARCAVAYAAGACLAPPELALLAAALEAERNHVARYHLFWAVTAVAHRANAPQRELEFLASLLAATEPTGSLNAQLARYLRDDVPPRGALPTGTVFAAVRRALPGGAPAAEWRVALLAAHFPCDEAWEFLRQTAKSPEERTRQAAIHAAWELAGADRAQAQGWTPGSGAPDTFRAVQMVEQFEEAARRPGR